MSEPTERIHISFPRTGQECFVNYDDTLADATFRYDLPIRYRCERAICVNCMTEVLEGASNLSEMKEREKQTLSAVKAKPNWRLACQVSVLGDVKLDYIPITDPRRRPTDSVENPI